MLPHPEPLLALSEGQKMNEKLDWLARIGVVASILLGIAQYKFNATGSWMIWLYIGSVFLMFVWVILNLRKKSKKEILLQSALPICCTVFCLVSLAHLLAS